MYLMYNLYFYCGVVLKMGWANILVWAECVRYPWLQAETKVATILGILVWAECVCCPWLQAETKVATMLGN